MAARPIPVPLRFVERYPAFPSYPHTTTSSLSITGGTVDISGVFKAIDFGKGAVTVSGGTLNIHDLERNSSGYSWALRGQVSDAEPQIVLIGGNISFSECVEWISFAGSVPAGAIQVSDEFGLSGLIGTYRVEETDDGKINQNEVRVYGDYTLHESISFSGYALEAIRWTAANGILNGYGGLFGPSGSITRTENMPSVVSNWYRP